MISAFVAAAAAEEEHNQSLLLPASYDLIWGGLCFLIVLVFFMRVVIPNLTRVLDARREAIEGGIQRADAAQAKATAALEEYTARLADARGEASQIRDQARADGAKIIAEARENAQSEASRVTSHAQAQIEAERQSAMVSLRSDVGTLALDLAGGVIGETLSDDAKAQAVVDRFLAELEQSESAQAPAPAERATT